MPRFLKLYSLLVIILLITCHPITLKSQINKKPFSELTPEEQLQYYNDTQYQLEQEYQASVKEWKSYPSYANAALVSNRKARREVFGIYLSKFLKRTSFNIEQFPFFAGLKEGIMNKREELETKYHIIINYQVDPSCEKLFDSKLGVYFLKAITKDEFSSEHRNVDVKVTLINDNGEYRVEYATTLGMALQNELDGKTTLALKSYPILGGTAPPVGGAYVTGAFNTFLESELDLEASRITPINIDQLKKLKNTNGTLTFITPSGKPFTLNINTTKRVSFYFNDAIKMSNAEVAFRVDGALQGFENTSSGFEYIPCYNPSNNTFAGYYKKVANSPPSVCSTVNMFYDMLSKDTPQKDCVIVVTACMNNGALEFEARKIPYTGQAWPTGINEGGGTYTNVLPVDYNTVGKVANLNDFTFSVPYSTNAKAFIKKVSTCEETYLPYVMQIASIVTNYPEVVSQCYGIERMYDDFDPKKHLLSASNSTSPQSTLQNYVAKVNQLVLRAQELRILVNNSSTSDNVTSNLTTIQQASAFINDGQNYCALNFISNAERIRLLKLVATDLMGDNETAAINLIKTLNLEKTTSQTYEFLTALTNPANNIGNVSLLTKLRNDIQDLFGNNYGDLIKAFTQKLTTKPDIANHYTPPNDLAQFNSLFFYDDAYLFTTPPIGTHKYEVEMLDNGDISIEKQYVKDYTESLGTSQGGDPYTIYTPNWATEPVITLPPFQLITFVNRSSLSSIKETTNAEDMLTVPALFFKYARDKTFTHTSLRITALAFDALTLVTGPAAIKLAYKAGRLGLALFEGAQVLASVGNVATNGLSPSSELKKWVDEYNLVIGIWGAGKLLTSIPVKNVFNINYYTAAKTALSSAVDEARLKNLVLRYDAIKSGLATHINNANTAAQIKKMVDYMRRMVNASAELTTSSAWKILINKLGGTPVGTLAFADILSISTDNFIDVVVHFKDGVFYVAKEGNWGNALSYEDLAYFIKTATSGKTARLLSCNDLEAAKQLSNFTEGRALYASDGWVDLYSNGVVRSQNDFYLIENGVQSTTNKLIKNSTAINGLQKLRLGLNGAEISLNAFKNRLITSVQNTSGLFSILHTDAEIIQIINKGKFLNLSDDVIDDMLFISCRNAKRINASDLMTQMDNWVNVISIRGYPYKFIDLAQFNSFKNELKTGLNNIGVSTYDVRIQGSALRTPAAKDVDLAAIISETDFDNFLVNRFSNKITKNGNTIDLSNKTKQQLIDIANDYDITPSLYNNQAKSFSKSMLERKVSAYSNDKVIPGFKELYNSVKSNYLNLNIENITIQTSGGSFDLKPYIKL